MMTDILRVYSHMHHNGHRCGVTTRDAAHHASSYDMNKDIHRSSIAGHQQAVAEHRRRAGKEVACAGAGLPALPRAHRGLRMHRRDSVNVSVFD